MTLDYKQRLVTLPVVFAILFLFFNIELSNIITENTENILAPIVFYSNGQEQRNFEKNIVNFTEPLFPLSFYSNMTQSARKQIEDYGTHEKALSTKVETKEVEKNENRSNLSVEKLKNFDYLLGHYYTVDGSTMVDETLLNAEEMLAKNLSINTKEKEPKILIFHTHSQESFQDSIKGDSSTTIVGMGAYLAELLNKKGISTIHHKGVYDLVNGKLDRSKAYELSEEGVRKILKEYPSIEVVIDLHRDGVNENTHLVTEIEGKQTAQIMFFNGLSRTKTNGEISYLPNPYIKDNLAFSFQMQLACEEMYPGFARRIYLKGYRYSLHMMPKSLLIEAGAQNNTVQEMKNAMEYLSNVLCRVLQKTS